MKRFPLPWAAICATVMSMPAWAAGRQLNVCYDDWAPYAYTGAGKKAAGITVDILNEAARSQNLRLNYVYTTYDACRKMVRLGKIDAKLFTSPDEDEDLPRLNTVTEYWMLSAIVRKESPYQHYSGLDMFRGASVGLVNGYVYPDEFKRNHQWQPVYDYESSSLLRQLVVGRIDATFDDLFWLQEQIREKRLPLKVLLPVIQAVPQYTIFSKARTREAQQLDGALKAMAAAGRIDEIYRQHTGETLRRWLEK